MRNARRCHCPAEASEERAAAFGDVGVDDELVSGDESELGPSALTAIVERWRTALPDLEFRIVDLASLEAQIDAP